MKNTAPKRAVFSCFLGWLWEKLWENRNPAFDYALLCELFLGKSRSKNGKRPEIITFQSVSFWRRERDSNPCPACTGYRISSADPSTTWVSLQLLSYYNQSDGKNQGLPKDILLSASLALFAAFRLILRLPNAPRSYRHPLHQRSG